MDEYYLLKKAKEGDRQSLSILLEQNYSMVYGFLLKTTLNEEIAKDLTQETMVKAITNIKKFRGDSKFSSWLIQISINGYKNEMRKWKKKRNWTDTLDISLASKINVEEDAEKKEQLGKIAAALRKLKAIDRLIFILKYYEGYDYKEISDITGVKLGTCKSKMHYLINKLKNELEVND